MKRRVGILVGVIAAIIGLTGTATVHAQSTTGDDSLTQSILQGLWDGAHFNFGPVHTPLPGSQTSTNGSTPSTPVPAPAPPTGRYAALGDSVAAGLGLPLSGTDATTTTCGRSTQAYAYTVAKGMNMTLIHGACSGATVGDLITKQAVSGPNIPAQLDTAYANGAPSLITITAGANDAHWQDFIRACYATNCNNTATTTLANAYLVSLQAKLYASLTAISARSGGTPPQVVLTGYYSPLSQACTSLQSNITADEITWLNGETSALNQTIQNVASHYSFARFAAVDFTGHDLCFGDSWIQGLTDSAPFHPTAAGQQAIASSVLHSLGK